MLEELLSMPVYVNGMLSPNGKWFAYEAENIAENNNVFLLSTDGRLRSKPLTENKHGSHLRSWSPDSDSIVIAENSEDHCGLLLIQAENPSTILPLMELEPPDSILGGVVSQHAKKRLFFSTDYDFSTNDRLESYWLWQKEMETGELTPLARPNRALPFEPQLNKNGTLVSYSQLGRTQAGNQIWTVDPQTRENKQILDFGDNARIDARWHSDGNQLVFSTNDKGYWRVGSYHTETKEIRWIVDDPSKNVSSAIPSQFGNWLILEYTEMARTTTELIHLDGNETLPIPDVDGTLKTISSLPNGEWIGIQYSSTHPFEIVRFRAEADAEIVHLTSMGQQMSITKKTLAKAEDYHWVSTDGRKIHGWLYKPRDPSKQLIIHVHDKPSTHCQDEFNPLIQYFVSNGFNVLAPNYRGSTGYGWEYENSICVNANRALEQDDIVAGAEALIWDAVCDMKKIGITGTGFGAYCCWNAIVHNPHELIAAAAPVCGAADLTASHAEGSIEHKIFWEEMLNGSPEAEARTYWERSPLNFFHNVEGKLLFVQGHKDRYLSMDTLHSIEQALTESHKQYVLIEFPDEGGAIKKKENKLKLYKKLVAFFKESLSG